eukprot:1555419-Pyramimonas_sp.AAC.1
MDPHEARALEVRAEIHLGPACRAPRGAGAPAASETDEEQAPRARPGAPATPQASPPAARGPRCRGAPGWAAGRSSGPPSPR